MSVEGQAAPLNGAAAKRPVGVSILAVLHVMGGVGLLAVQVAYRRGLGDAAAELGFSQLHLLFSVVLLGVLGVVSGLGMWLGRRWGWWLAVFSYAYAVLRAGNVLLILTQVGPELGVQQAEMTRHAIKFGGRIALNSLLIVYFCRPAVRKFFKTGHIGYGAMIVKVGAGLAAGTLAEQALIALG